MCSFFRSTHFAGHVYLHADNGAACFLDLVSGRCQARTDGSLVSPPARPTGISTTYPFSGSAVMLALVPDADNLVKSVDIVIFGGSDKRLHGPSIYNSRGFTGGAWTGGYNATAQALRHSYRITISWVPGSTTGSYSYSFGNGWRTSDMGYPRIMSGEVVYSMFMH
jgi:hypothetical protein